MTPPLEPVEASTTDDAPAAAHAPSGSTGAEPRLALAAPTAQRHDGDAAEAAARAALGGLWRHWAVLAVTWVAAWAAGLGALADATWPLVGEAAALGAATGTAIAIGWLAAGATGMARRLSAGDGSALATWTGAEPVGVGFDAGPGPHRLDSQEATLLEVARAAAQQLGLPRPRLFVWQGEPAINALAAGWAPSTAAVVVSRGALDKLTARELQALVSLQLMLVRSGQARFHLGAVSLLAAFDALRVAGEHARRPDPVTGAPAGALRHAVGSLAAGVGALAAPWALLLRRAAARTPASAADRSLAAEAPSLVAPLTSTLQKVWYEAEAQGDALHGARLALLAPFLLWARPQGLRTHVPPAERVRALAGQDLLPLPTGPLGAALAPQGAAVDASSDDDEDWAHTDFARVLGVAAPVDGPPARTTAPTASPVAPAPDLRAAPTVADMAPSAAPAVAAHPADIGTHADDAASPASAPAPAPGTPEAPADARPEAPASPAVPEEPPGEAGPVVADRPMAPVGPDTPAPGGDADTPSRPGGGAAAQRWAATLAAADRQAHPAAAADAAALAARVFGAPGDAGRPTDRAGSTILPPAVPVAGGGLVVRRSPPPSPAPTEAPPVAGARAAEGRFAYLASLPPVPPADSAEGRELSRLVGPALPPPAPRADAAGAGAMPALPPAAAAADAETEIAARRALGLPPAAAPRIALPGPPTPPPPAAPLGALAPPAATDDRPAPVPPPAGGRRRWRWRRLRADAPPAGARRDGHDDASGWPSGFGGASGFGPVAGLDDDGETPLPPLPPIPSLPVETGVAGRLPAAPADPLPTADRTPPRGSPRPPQGRGLAPASEATPVPIAPITRPLALPAAPPTSGGAADGDGPAREAAARLARLGGRDELRAAILGCMLAPGGERERQAWTAEIGATEGLSRILADLALQPRAARMPWFSELVRRAAGGPLEDRRSLVEAARRVMTAAGVVKPLDRLRWLALRHGLGSATRKPLAPAGPKETGQSFYRANLQSIATYTAFLARLIPLYTTDVGIDPIGERWYQAVLQRFIGVSPLPPCRVPDSDALVHALRALQALSWLNRPPLIRAWVGEAIAHGGTAGLSPEAADALFLTCLLLDSPMPVELSRHFPPIALGATGGR